MIGSKESAMRGRTACSFDGQMNKRLRERNAGGGANRQGQSRFAKLTPARHRPAGSAAAAPAVLRLCAGQGGGVNYTKVHSDVGKLKEHGLVQRTRKTRSFVPFEWVEIHLALFNRAA